MGYHPYPFCRRRPGIGRYRLSERCRNRTSPAKMAVLMHGWGADRDLVPLAPMLATDAEMAVIVPDAPDICSVNPFGRQWFELASSDLASEMVAQACSGGAPVIHQMLDSLSADFGVSAENIFLGGFSQGGMIALGAAAISGLWAVFFVCPVAG